MIIVAYYKYGSFYGLCSDKKFQFMCDIHIHQNFYPLFSKSEFETHNLTIICLKSPSRCKK